MTIDEKLKAFALWAITESRGDLGDLDGVDIQDKCVELGLLVSVMAKEPCGENCRCVEWDDFPQECLRYSEELRVEMEKAKT